MIVRLVLTIFVPDAILIQYEYSITVLRRIINNLGHT